MVQKTQHRKLKTKQHCNLHIDTLQTVSLHGIYYSKGRFISFRRYQFSRIEENLHFRRYLIL